jgi:hypothetical protein
MHEDFIFQWQLLLYPLAVLAYFELLRRLDSRWARKMPLTDEEFLSFYAKSRAISEYDVFILAAPNWSVGPPQVQADFKSYLQQGLLPHYVRDFIRKAKSETDVRRS